MLSVPIIYLAGQPQAWDKGIWIITSGLTYEARHFSLGKLGGERKRELVVAERFSVWFVKMVESKLSRIAKDPGNPLRLRLRQLCSRRVKKREGQGDLHKAAHMKRFDGNAWQPT